MQDREAAFMARYPEDWPLFGTKPWPEKADKGQVLSQAAALVSVLEADAEHFALHGLRLDGQAVIVPKYLFKSYCCCGECQ
jgi:hypothetical protein